MALLLIDARVDPSAGNQFAIRMASENASENGHHECAALLLADSRVHLLAEDYYELMAPKNSLGISELACVVNGSFKIYCGS